MCQSRFINCIKHITLMKYTDNGGSYDSMWAEGYMGNLCTFSQFCYDLKTSLKNKALKNSKTQPLDTGLPCNSIPDAFALTTASPS